MTDIHVKGFRPPVVELPEADPIPAGELRVFLPSLAVTWCKFDLLDAKVAGELPGYHVAVTLAEPLPRPEAAELVALLLPTLEAIHSKTQEAVDRRGPLLSFEEAARAGLVTVAIANSVGY